MIDSVFPESEKPEPNVLSNSTQRRRERRDKRRENQIQTEAQPSAHCLRARLSALPPIPELCSLRLSLRSLRLCVEESFIGTEAHRG